MVILAIPIGLLIGLSLGALGGGGSILTVPALVYLLGQNPHSSTTASLIIVGVTALAGMGVHWRARRVRAGAGLVFGVLGAGGSYLGSRLSASVSPDALLAAFSVLIAMAAVTMLRRRVAAGAGRAPATLPAASGGGTAHAPLSPPRVVLAATAVGLLTGFFGVGGGFVVVPTLVLVLGFDMATAVGTSLLVIAINSATALASRLFHQAHLDPALLAAFTLAAIAGAFAGGRVASRTRPERLAQGFAVLLLAVAVYTAARSVPGLI